MVGNLQADNAGRARRRTAVRYVQRSGEDVRPQTRWNLYRPGPRPMDFDWVGGKGLEQQHQRRAPREDVVDLRDAAPLAYEIAARGTRVAVPISKSPAGNVNPTVLAVLARMVTWACQCSPGTKPSAGVAGAGLGRLCRSNPPPVMGRAVTARGLQGRASARRETGVGVAARPSRLPSVESPLPLERLTSIEVELLIGAESCRLGEEDAWELVHAIRARCIDREHRPLDLDAVQCLQLADTLAIALEDGKSHPLVDVSLPQARALADYVLTPSIARSKQLQNLFASLVRSARGRY